MLEGRFARPRSPSRAEHPVPRSGTVDGPTSVVAMFELGLVVIAVILIPALVILSLVTLILVEQD